MKKEELRQFIVETILENNQSSRSNFEKIKKSRGGGQGVTLSRVGGLSPVKQAKGVTPEKKGVWAFIWPYFDTWFLSGTNDRGTIEWREDGTPHGGSRIDQFKRSGTRKFVHKGPIYTRLPVPGAIEDNETGFYLTTGVELNKYMTKLHALLDKEIKTDHRKYGGTIKNFTPYASKPEKYFALDHFEVFVPNPEGT